MNDGINNPRSESPDADAAFDALLRTAMQSRPEPQAPPDLAQRAMALATADDHLRLAQHAQALARQRRWTQITGIAATLLIVTMLAGAAKKMWTRGDIAAIASATTSADTDSTTGDSTTSATTTSGTSTTTILVVSAAELLVLGVILASLTRRTSVSPWGAEVAGMW